MSPRLENDEGRREGREEAGGEAGRGSEQKSKWTSQNNGKPAYQTLKILPFACFFAFLDRFFARVAAVTNSGGNWSKPVKSTTPCSLIAFTLSRAESLSPRSVNSFFLKSLRAVPPPRAGNAATRAGRGTGDGLDNGRSHEWWLIKVLGRGEEPYLRHSQLGVVRRSS